MDTITDTYTANEAIQLLIIHHKHPEHEINLSTQEVKHLELSVIDDWENLSKAYARQLVPTTKLELLSNMSNNESYLR